MAINKQQIHSALTHVLHPVLGKDPITLNMIRDLVVQEKYVTFTIELAEENPNIESKLRELCEDAIHRYVDGEAVLDIQTSVNPFRQKEVENRAVEGLDKNGANPMSMQEPTADHYTPPATIDPVSYEELPSLLQRFVDEHETFLHEIRDFEEALLRFKKNRWVMDEEMNTAFGRFFTFMDEVLLEHNRREEKKLFPLLHKRLVESGEHSKYEAYMSDGDRRTAVEVMEDEHIKFIQLSGLTFNFLGLAPRLPDVRSQSMVSDLAFEQGRRLIEMLRLHIQRENKTLFPLACSLIEEKEFDRMDA